MTDKKIRRTVGLSLLLEGQVPTRQVINEWAEKLNVPDDAEIDVHGTNYLTFSWMESL